LERGEGRGEGRDREGRGGREKGTIESDNDKCQVK